MLLIPQQSHACCPCDPAGQEHQGDSLERWRKSVSYTVRRSIMHEGHGPVCRSPINCRHVHHPLPRPEMPHFKHAYAIAGSHFCLRWQINALWQNFPPWTQTYLPRGRSICGYRLRQSTDRHSHSNDFAGTRLRKHPQMCLPLWQLQTSPARTDTVCHFICPCWRTGLLNLIMTAVLLLDGPFAFCTALLSGVGCLRSASLA